MGSQTELSLSGYVQYLICSRCHYKYPYIGGSNHGPSFLILEVESSGCQNDGALVGALGLQMLPPLCVYMVEGERQLQDLLKTHLYHGSNSFTRLILPSLLPKHRHTAL